MKLTRHNGRAGKNGAYNPKHNDRRFDIENSEHIDADRALHFDEGIPHIHKRHVFDCQNNYGELCPQQEKALEELGIPLPNIVLLESLKDGILYSNILMKMYLKSL